MRRLVALLISLVFFLAPASTTTASEAVFAYDVPAISRVEVHEFDDAPASPARLTDVRQGSASPPAEPSGAVTTPPNSFIATEAVPGIKTPYGVAEQGTDAGSIALRGQVESGGTVYRQGVTGTQQTAEGQFWAGQNPASTPGYANSYGTPSTQVAQGEYPWIMGGTVQPGTPFVTRGAPGIGTNVGGAPEVVVNPGGVRNLWFHMPE